MLFSEAQSAYASHCGQWEPWVLSPSDNPGPRGATFPDVTHTQHHYPACHDRNREIRKGFCRPTALYVTTLQRAALTSPKCVYITLEVSERPASRRASISIKTNLLLCRRLSQQSSWKSNKGALFTCLV